VSRSSPRHTCDEVSSHFCSAGSTPLKLIHVFRFLFLFALVSISFLFLVWVGVLVSRYQRLLIFQLFLLMA